MTKMREGLAATLEAKLTEDEPYAFYYLTPQQVADAALAALGLDDLDAAAGRLAEQLSRVVDLHPENLHGFAVRALEATLTCSATEGADDGDQG